MGWVSAAIGVAIIVAVLVDIFEVMLLPRRVTHGLRFARLFYRTTWIGWRALASLLPAGRRRNGLLGYFGPLSLMTLLAAWALALVFGYALVYWPLGEHFKLDAKIANEFQSFLYFSGTNFVTLGYGDVTPVTQLTRTLSILEAGTGLGLLAVVVGYLPVLYQAFSRREAAISLLDARAGSPPTAGELLRRYATGCCFEKLEELLADWERWSAELLESHLSFPVLSYYRSQHDNQSWLAMLTVVLDTSALMIAAAKDHEAHQARLTFAMARHAAVDLGLVFRAPPGPMQVDRASDEELQQALAALRSAGFEIADEHAWRKAVGELRELYEPFVLALAEQCQLTIPRLQPAKPPVDNWQTSPWKLRSPALGDLPTARTEAEHYG